MEIRNSRISTHLCRTIILTYQENQILLILLILSKKNPKLPWRSVNIPVINGVVSLVGGGGGEDVAAFVFGVAIVAFDPFPGDFMVLHGGVHPSPEVGVFEWLIGAA
jgi:hypothetical protein